MTFTTNRPVRRFAAAFVATAAWILAAAPAAAQSGPVLVLLDKDAVAVSVAPNGFSPNDINATIAAAGVRDVLPFAPSHTGQPMSLPAGQIGSEGWFAFTSVPPSWSSADSNDGLQNFFFAGAGLGSPDSTGNRESLLDNISGIKPLHATELQMLSGRQVCAVVYAGDVAWSDAVTSLRGANLGIMAFTVLGTGGGDGVTLPNVSVQILDAGSTCSDVLSVF
jgi:hypothetical protein